MKKLLLVSALLGSLVSVANAEEAMDRSDVLDRIKPVGTVNVQGMSVTAAAAPIKTVMEKAPEMAMEPEVVTPTAMPAIDGKAVYQTACFACHGTGAAGAPILGNKAAWAPRIAQGDAMLLDHALKGFNGMPPKGGRMDLSDETIAAIVDYMVAESK
jgi:cytochrome c5